jgi:formate hydrogenlyase transcriptional activator
MDDTAGPHTGRFWTRQDVEDLPPGIEDDLLQALRKLTSTLDVNDVCEAVLGGVEAVFGATSSWIMLHDTATNLLRTQVFRGRGADVYRELELPADRGVAGLAFTRREIQFVPDASADNRWFDPELVHRSGLKSVFVLPLMVRDKAIGVLGIDAPRFGPTRPPADLDVKRLELFAAQAAIGIINARQYESSQKDRARLRSLLRERRQLRDHVMELREQVRQAYSFGDIVGTSDGIREVLDELSQVASSDVSVLILGETGTGKELLARAVHEQSGRRARSFVAVNCAALPEHLVESEMFGHERGAFTGAHARKPGRFELAHRGTLFLDEVGDLPLNAQAKLLRVLQDGEVHRVGSTHGVKVDVRVIAATNQDLAARIGDRGFREDLYYRLSVFPIRVPPLRERIEDIPLLAVHIAVRFSARIGKNVRGIEQRAIELLTAYPWPGNVRELQNVIERAVILTSRDVIPPEAIRLDGPLPSSSGPRSPESARATPDDPDHDELRSRTLADAERAAIIEALRSAACRISGSGGAAAILGLRPTTLHAKMKKLGIRRSDILKM